MINNALKNRFLKYISFDTQSDESSKTIPSTSKQKELGKFLKNELNNLGLTNAFIDEFGYVYAYLESNCHSDKTIGLISHMDTSDEASGANVKPVIIENYQGQIINVNKELGVVLNPSEFPYLLKQLGHELITTDGTTLLGADDKAGIAIIMTAIDELINGKIDYPNIIITFTPDEEIGRGTDKFNYDFYKEHNCSIAYTIDGGEPNYINYENFNAASAIITINGKSIHPGSAKGKMINSQLIAMEFNSLLPSNMLPSLTDGYEGFNHLTSIEGTVSKTTMSYIIRNHDMNKFNQQKELFLFATDFLNKKYGANTINTQINDSYYNMKDLVLTNKDILTKVEDALKENGLEPVYDPIRGGTDGARLTYSGILTPNLGTGGQNYHGPFEYLDVDEASTMVNVVKSLAHNFLK